MQMHKNDKKCVQPHLMGWMRLVFLAEVIHSWNDTRQCGAKSIFNSFQRGSVFDLMFVGVENAASHKYVVQKGKSLPRASWVGYSFLVLIQKSHKVCFENRSSKPLSLDKSANSSWAFNDRCVTSDNCLTNGSRIQLSFPESMSVGNYFRKRV